MIMIKRCLKKF